MRRALFLVLVSALVTGAAAQEQPDVDEELALCRRLAEQGKVETAIQAYEDLFAAHPRDPVILENLRDIEEDLKRCHFRKQYRKPRGEDLFGPAAKRYIPSSRKVLLKYEHEPEGPHWMSEGGQMWILDIAFEGRLELRMDTLTVTPDRKPLVVMLCYDTKKEGGYFVVPGAHLGYAYVPASITRVDDGKPARLGSTKVSHTSSDDLVVLRTGNQIKLSADGKAVLSASDRKYKKGFVGFLNMLPGSLTIEGRIERTAFRQITTAHENQAFETWENDVWDRRKVLPAWALGGSDATAADTTLRMPSGRVVYDVPEMVRLIENCVLGDCSELEELEKKIDVQRGAAKDYLTAVVRFGEGDLKAAAASLTEVLKAEPEFGPALALRGLLRLYLRRTDEARADLDRARALVPDFVWPYLGLVRLEILDGDLDAAAAVLAEGVEAGVRSEWMETFGSIIHRARRGPLWTRCFDLETSHFVIKSDHSRTLCREVAHHLEAAVKAYALRFPFVTTPKRKGRVYVFADQDGYMRYAEDMAMNLAGSAGAYNPKLNEMVLFLPLDRSRFVHTIRHEGFHRFVHAYLERAPHWWNEGNAEYFAAAEERFGGGLKPGAVNDRAVTILKMYRKDLTPIRELLVMDAREFMSKAPLHYAQSWLLVHCLHNTNVDALSAAFKGYFKSLREGLSAKEAYEHDLLPVLDVLEKAYRAHLRSMCGN